jgi:hypothetical protein
MNARHLQTILTAALLVVTATSFAEPLRGEIILSATAHELLGDDAADLFGSALDPEEVIEDLNRGRTTANY